MSPEELAHAKVDMIALARINPLSNILLSWTDAWAILCAVQIASRHPAATTSPTVQRAIAAAHHIQGYVSRTPALATLAQLGWDPDQDSPTYTTDKAMTDEEEQYDNGLVRCPGCGNWISFSAPAPTTILDLACPDCSTIFQIEKPEETPT